MIKSEIIDYIYDDLGIALNLKKNIIEAILSSYEQALVKGLGRDGKVPLLNLGTLQTEEKQPRMVKNIHMEEAKEIPARLSLIYKPTPRVKQHAADNDFEKLAQRLRTKKKTHNRS